MTLAHATRAAGPPGGIEDDRRPRPAGPGLQGGPAARRPARPPAGFLVAGAHGGSGTSTVAGLLRAALDYPGAPPLPVRALPAFPDGDPEVIAARTRLPGPFAGPLVVTALGTAEGLRRAIIAVTALERLGAAPAALAVTADGAGPMPRAAAERLALLEGRAGMVVLIPFAAAMRAAADPSRARVPRSVHRAVGELAALASGPRGRWAR